jgi:hypothetical protein
MTTTRLSSSWRAPAILMLLVSGGIHLALIPEHLQEAPYIGYLFIADTLACVVLAVALVVRDAPVVWAASGVLSALALAAYVASRSVGLPQIGDDVGQWFGTLGVAAVLSEVAALLIASWVLHRAQATSGPGTPIIAGRGAGSASTGHQRDDRARRGTGTSWWSRLSESNRRPIHYE